VTPSAKPADMPAITALEKKLLAWHKSNPVSQRLASIPGGNRYLRRLLINGASANLLRTKATNANPWVIGLRRRRPPLVVAVALANKTARIAWAVMLREPRRRRWSLRESNDA
jgi:transposase